MSHDSDQPQALSHRQLRTEDAVDDVVGNLRDLVGGCARQALLQQHGEGFGRDALGVFDREVRLEAPVGSLRHPNEGVRLAAWNAMALIERTHRDARLDLAESVRNPDEELDAILTVGKQLEVLDQSTQPLGHSCHPARSSTMIGVHLTFPIRSDKLALSVRVERHVAHAETPFQTIDIYDTAALGRILTLDGHIQLATLDERAYHEALVQVPLLNTEEARRALVVGGGDGGVLREICRHESIERIEIVEIDRAVIDLCREHLPEVSDGAFDDPRVHLHVGDAFAFVAGAHGEYDLIVVDCTDVYEEEDGGISAMLFTDDFYRDCLRCLAPGGFVVTQADNLLFCPYSRETILQAFGRVFPATGSYWALVPSFGGFSGYAWASRGHSMAGKWSDLVEPRSFTYLDQSTYELGMGRLPIG